MNERQLAELVAHVSRRELLKVLAGLGVAHGSTALAAAGSGDQGAGGDSSGSGSDGGYGAGSAGEDSGYGAGAGEGDGGGADQGGGTDGGGADQNGETDNMTPAYLTISPTGQVGAVFPGGVLLDEQTVLAYAKGQALGWLDAAGSGNVYEWIAAGVIGGSKHSLLITSEPDANDYAQIQFTAESSGATVGDSVITLSLHDDAGGNATADLLNSARQSSFLQLDDSKRSSAGSSSLVFSASYASALVNVSLPGATGTVYGIGTCEDSGGSAVIVCCRPGVGSCNFLGFWTGGDLSATLPFSYIVWEGA